MTISNLFNVLFESNINVEQVRHRIPKLDKGISAYVRVRERERRTRAKVENDDDDDDDYDYDYNNGDRKVDKEKFKTHPHLYFCLR